MAVWGHVVIERTCRAAHRALPALCLHTRVRTPHRAIAVVQHLRRTGRLGAETTRVLHRTVSHLRSAGIVPVDWGPKTRSALYFKIYLHPKLVLTCFTSTALHQGDDV